MAPFYINGTTGISGVDGSAATPALQGTDTNTGISFGNDVIIASTGGTERWRTDASGRVLVGTNTSTATSRLAVIGSVGDAPGFVQLTPSSDPVDGGYLGGLLFTGAEYTKISAQIHAAREGANWTSTSKPGSLVFSTTPDGAASSTQRGKFGSDGYLYCYQSYAGTTAIAANLVVLSNGAFLRSSSSAKYKTQIEDLQSQYADALLACRPVWYRSTCAADNPNHGYWGFIAEEVAEIDPRLVQWKTVEISYDEKGSAVETPCEPEPEGVAYDRFVPHLLNLIKRQQQAIETLEAKVAALEAA
jgi:hypothetical protein